MTLQIRNLDVEILEQHAKAIRRSLIGTFYKGRGGHFGGCLSIIDLLTALYLHTMRLDPDNPDHPDRDRFILSKGHSGVALACTLAEVGLLPKEWLGTYGDIDSPITSHPESDRTPGIDMSTGSLGHGLAIAAGMALASKTMSKGFRAFVIMGDGESHEGSVWEAGLAAAHYELDNLVAITDFNKLCMDGPISDVMELAPLAAKWSAFGWEFARLTDII